MTKQSIKSLTKRGLSQKAIALKLHIRKSKVVAFQKKAKIGVRRASVFWSDVKSYQRVHEESWKVAVKDTKDQPYWARKRAVRQGKQYKSYSVFWREWKEKWRDATQEERDKHGYEATYGEEGEFVGGTPH